MAPGKDTTRRELAALKRWSEYSTSSPDMTSDSTDSDMAALLAEAASVPLPPPVVFDDAVVDLPPPPLSPDQYSINR